MEYSTGKGFPETLETPLKPPMYYNTLKGINFGLKFELTSGVRVTYRLGSLPKYLNFGVCPQIPTPRRSILPKKDPPQFEIWLWAWFLRVQAPHPHSCKDSCLWVYYCYWDA